MSYDSKTESVSNATTNLSPRVELVDNWHVLWSNVLDLVDRVGDRQSLHIDRDGWLSARQNLLVAFVGPRAAGYICFRVQPVIDADRHVVFTPEGKPALEGYVECFGVDAAYAASGIRQLLIDRATIRSIELHCETLRMQGAASAC